MARAVALVAISVLLAAGCGARPPADVVGPSVRPSGPSPALTQEPALPAGLDRQVTIERDGLRITLELERNPMPAGEATWVTSTVQNVGPDGIQYFPCGDAMSVIGQVDGLPWRPGRALANPAGAWKGYLMDHQGVRDGERQIVFLPAGQTGSSSGCGDIGYVEILGPGDTLRERAQWDGLTFRRLAPPPTSRIDLVGMFAYAHADRPEIDAPRLEVGIHLDTWIAGRPDAYLDPGEVADIALGDPRLTALLVDRDLGNGNEGVLIFDPASATYPVGMLESGNLPVARAHLLTIDAVTGEIEGFVERDWNYEVDDYP